MCSYDLEASLGGILATNFDGKDGRIVLSDIEFVACFPFHLVVKMTFDIAGIVEQTFYCVDCKKVAWTVVHESQ